MVDDGFCSGETARRLLAVIFFSVAMLAAGVAQGQECPADAPLFCSNCGGYCCPESHPFCTEDCQCAADDGSGGTGGGGDGCGSGAVMCGGEYCIPEGTVCCAPQGYPHLYCPSGSECGTDGMCYSDDGGSTDPGGGSGDDGPAIECDSGHVATQAECGGDQCSCAAPCTLDSECVSGCCADGYCSLPCVCEEGANQEIGCGSDGSSSGSSSDGEFSRDDRACSTGGQNPGFVLLLMVMVVGVLVAVRRFGAGEGQRPEPTG